MSIKIHIDLLVIVVVSQCVTANAETPNMSPIANAGYSRYVGTDQIQLDGTQSYDPDNTGPLDYDWTQVSGPSVEISGTATATATWPRGHHRRREDGPR